MNHNFELDQVIAKIAREFVQIDDLNLSINKALKTIGEYSGASRAYIFLIQDTLMSNEYEWCNNGVSSEIKNLKNLPIDMFPWWIEQLKSDEILLVSDVSKLSEEACEEKKILESQNIKSVLVMPIYSKGILIGFVGFDNVLIFKDWSDKEKTVLYLISDLFSNVFERKIYEEKLIEKNEKLEQTVAELRKAKIKLVQHESMLAFADLAASLAHEINNPLSFFKSNLGILQEEFDNLCKIQKKKFNVSEIAYLKGNISEEIEQVFMDLFYGVERIASIVESLKYFSGVETTEYFEIYNLNKNIDNILSLIDFKFENIEIIKLYNNIPNLKVDVKKMNYILMQLLLLISDRVYMGKKTKKIYCKFETIFNSDVVCLRITDNSCSSTNIDKNNKINMDMLNSLVRSLDGHIKTIFDLNNNVIELKIKVNS